MFTAVAPLGIALQNPRVHSRTFDRIRILALNGCTGDFLAPPDSTSTKALGPVVRSIVSLTSSLRGQLVKCFMTL